jgi:hypothetical protein
MLDLDTIAKEKTLKNKNTHQLYVDALRTSNKLKIFSLILAAKHVSVSKKISLFVYTLLPLIASIGLLIKKVRPKNRSAIKY